MSVFSFTTWRPDTDVGMVFDLRFEWVSAVGGALVSEVPTCIRATVDGVEVSDPQTTYENALVYNNAIQRAEDQFEGAVVTRAVAPDGVLEITVSGVNQGQANAIIAWMENRYSVTFRFINGANVRTLSKRAR